MLSEVRQTAHGEAVEKWDWLRADMLKDGETVSLRGACPNFFTASECACYFLKGIVFYCKPQAIATTCANSCCSPYDAVLDVNSSIQLTCGDDNASRSGMTGGE